MAEAPHFFDKVPDFVKEDGDTNKIARLSTPDLMLVSVNKNGYAPKRSFFENVNGEMVRNSFTKYGPTDKYDWDPTEHSIEHSSVDADLEISSITRLYGSANAFVTLVIGDYNLALSYYPNDEQDITSPIHLAMLVLSNSVVQEKYRVLQDEGLMTQDESINDKHRGAAIRHVLKPLKAFKDLDIEMTGDKFHMSYDTKSKMFGIKTRHNQQDLLITIPEINPSVKQLKDATFPREAEELIVREPSYLRDIKPLAIFGITVTSS